MANYHIFDAYAYLHAAENLQSYQGQQAYGLPTGGISYFLRYIVTELFRQDCVAIAFDQKFTTGCPRQLEGYKSNRSAPSDWLLVQAEFLYHMLRECGFPCFRGFGEADDHIHGLCVEARKLVSKTSFGNIYIHGVDYDLCHDVDSITFFSAATSQVKNVSPITYPHVLGDSKTGTPCMLGTISAKKTLVNDASDSITMFKSKSGKAGIVIYQEFCDWLRENKPPMDVIRDPQALFIFIEAFYPDDLAEVRKRALTIYPKDLGHKMHYSFCSWKAGDDFDNVNFELLFKYVKALHLYPTVKILARYFDAFKEITKEDVQPQLDLVQRFGKDFNSGAFSADHNLSPSSSFVHSESIQLLGSLFDDDEFDDDEEFVD